MNFRDLLDPQKRAEMEQRDEYVAKRGHEMRAMDNETFAVAVKLALRQMRDPPVQMYNEKGDAVPTYNSVFWHMYVPELIRRVEES